MNQLFRELLAVNTTPKITLQISTDMDAAARALRVRHQLESVEADLVADGMSRNEVAATIDKLRDLANGPEVTAAREGTVGIYVAGGFARSALWPALIVERTVVGEEFYLADIVGLASPAHCFILELSRGGVRLFRADCLSLNEVELSDVPADLAAATAHLDPERQLQFHQSQPVGQSGTAASYHGHGIGEGRDVEELKNYLRAVDRGVRAAMVGDAGPLALVGSDDLPAHFRAISHIGQLITEVDHKHPDAVSTADLRQIADAMLQRAGATEVDAAREQIRNVLGAGKGSVNLQAAVGAAIRGRVDTLLIGPEFGGSDVAVNRAIVATMRQRGKVLPDPGLSSDTPVAALFRY